MVPDLMGVGRGKAAGDHGVWVWMSMVETFAVAVVGGLTGSACGAGILMWARHRERELDLEERATDQMAAEANTFAGAAAAAQGLHRVPDRQQRDQVRGEHGEAVDPDHEYEREVADGSHEESVYKRIPGFRFA